ncbi:hypothetical protein SESBI_10707 [Sesbania bispinosa]|nr:hypothetical protein SESBI_10707 [Sesbania bispinosa]
MRKLVPFSVRPEETTIRLSDSINSATVASRCEKHPFPDSKSLCYKRECRWDELRQNREDGPSRIPRNCSYGSISKMRFEGCIAVNLDRIFPGCSPSFRGRGCVSMRKLSFISGHVMTSPYQLWSLATTGAAAGALVTKKSRGSSTLSKRYMASLLSEYTTPVTVALTTPVEMLTLLPYDSTFSGSLVGSFPATVCTGLLNESKLELETYSGRMWNCNSSIFWPSFRELRNPAFSCEKAESSGARMVKPPLLAVMSCELMLFMISVVFRRRVRTVNVLAFLRILVMSSGAAFCEAFGADAGATTAAVVEEYKEENMREGLYRGLEMEEGRWNVTFVKCSSSCGFVREYITADKISSSDVVWNQNQRVWRLSFCEDFGAAAGATAAVVKEYKEENMIRRGVRSLFGCVGLGSEKERDYIEAIRPTGKGSDR